MTTWRKELEREMANHDEIWHDLVKIYCDGDLDHEWVGYDWEDQCIVMAWSKERVYFVDYYTDWDGDYAELISSAPRNPGKEAKKPR